MRRRRKLFKAAPSFANDVASARSIIITHYNQRAERKRERERGRAMIVSVDSITTRSAQKSATG